jgi:hypothetical protein
MGLCGLRFDGLGWTCDGEELYIFSNGAHDGRDVDGNVWWMSRRGKYGSFGWKFLARLIRI